MLRKQGHAEVTPRRLERWCAAGLGPLEGLEFSCQLAHFAAVAAISRSGRDAEVTARRLAARGFPSERLRASVLSELGIDPIGKSSSVPTIDLSSSPSGDSGFAFVEHIAHSMMVDTVGPPPLMARVFRALHRNAIRHAEELGEPADVIFHSFLVNGLAHIMGGDYYNGKAMAAVLNLDVEVMSFDVLDVMNTGLRICPRELEDTYRNAPLEQIVAMAQRIRAWAPGVLEHLGVTGAEAAEIEDLSAVFAPAAIHFVHLLQAVFDDFPQELPTLGAASRAPAQISSHATSSCGQE